MINKPDSLKLIESYGETIANQVRVSLMEDQTLAQIKPELDFIAKNWYDPLTPALIILSSRSIKKRQRSKKEICIALGLVNLTINLWDNILDNHSSKLFKDTFYGVFGKESTLLVGGLALAKANAILMQLKLGYSKKMAISTLVLDMWNKLGLAEIEDFRLGEKATSLQKLLKFKREAVYTEMLMHIGAILSDATPQEKQALCEYGRLLGMILEVSKDLELSLNLTAQLSERLASNKLTYSLLWASENSEKVKTILKAIFNKKITSPEDIEMLVSILIKAGTAQYVFKTVEGFCQQAIQELVTLKENKAKHDLEKFVGVQLQLLREKLGLS